MTPITSDPVWDRAMNQSASECGCDMAGYARTTHKDDGWLTLHDELLGIEDLPAFDALQLMGSITLQEVYDGFVADDLERFAAQHRWRDQPQAIWAFGYFRDCILKQRD